MMKNFYNYEIIIMFTAGLFAWALAVAVVSIKNVRKGGRAVHSIKTDAGNDNDQTNKNGSSDLLPNIRHTLVNTGIQPLLIVVFINLLDRPNELNIIGAFGLVIFVIFHEFYLSDKYSTKLFYQLIILLMWIIFFLILSYWTNYYKV